MTAENSEFLKIDTQVCLVSREPMPNLLPILHFSPRSVILIATPEMHENANRLKAVIHQNKPQLAVDVEYLSSAYDYDAIVETMFNVLIHVDKAAPEGEIVLNATGGTKLMVLAAVSVFTANNKKIFYLNVENGEIIFIPVSGTDLMHSKQAIHIPISLVDYLKVHGYSVQKSDVPVRELSYDFFEQLVSQQQKFEQAIAAVNAVAQNALENFKARKGLGAEIQNADSSGLKRLLSIFQDEKLLFLQQNKVVFPDESARFTVNGGWFEDYTYSVVKNMRSDGVTHAEANLRIAVNGQEIGKGADNEIDVCFMHKNSIYIVEVKTCLMNETKVTTPILDKLIEIQRQMGKRARMILVSYQRVCQAARIRARQNHIAVIDGNSICRLKSNLLTVLNTEESHL